MPIHIRVSFQGDDERFIFLERKVKEQEVFHKTFPRARSPFNQWVLETLETAARREFTGQMSEEHEVLLNEVRTALSNLSVVQHDSLSSCQENISLEGYDDEFFNEL